jgi:hypothetical protein
VIGTSGLSIVVSSQNDGTSSASKIFSIGEEILKATVRGPPLSQKLQFAHIFPDVDSVPSAIG